jgi:hypothetical protein
MATAGAYFANPGSSTLLHPTIAHLDEVIFGRADGGPPRGLDGTNSGRLFPKKGMVCWWGSLAFEKGCSHDPGKYRWPLLPRRMCTRGAHRNQNDVRPIIPAIRS